jgi:small conductance mechanosensitive channel
MEDQYVVGDMISVDDMKGTVEKLELRVTKLRSFNGDLYIVPNGEIRKLTNHTRGNKAVIVDVPLAYSADINKAIEIASEVCLRVKEEYETIVDDPKVLGITELGKESLNLRIMATALPNEQWEIERRIRKLIKEEFSKENIKFYDKNILKSE